MTYRHPSHYWNPCFYEFYFYEHSTDSKQNPQPSPSSSLQTRTGVPGGIHGLRVLVLQMFVIVFIASRPVSHLWSLKCLFSLLTKMNLQRHLRRPKNPLALIMLYQRSAMKLRSIRRSSVCCSQYNICCQLTDQAFWKGTRNALCLKIQLSKLRNTVLLSWPHTLPMLV